jgi:LysM repeat protein
VVLCSLFIALFIPHTAAAQDQPLSPQAQQILDAVNQARIDNGLPPLVLNGQLTLAAQRHVDDVVANGNWGHYGSDGSNVRLRVSRVGYPSSAVSENWVAVSDPGQAIGWWMNDWIHRVNILEPRWDEVGVGAAQAPNGFWILVTDFGNIDGGALPPIVEAAPVTQLTADGDITAQAIPADGEYAIQSGDTLLGIAYRFGLDWQDIALANDMGEDDLLQIGQVIRLPVPNGVGGPAAAVTSDVVAGKQVHVVRTGETLWTIAARYQIAWEDIAAVNGLGEYDLLQIEQELKLPASLDEPEASAPEAEPSAESGAEADAESEGESAGGADAAQSDFVAGSASGSAADEGVRFAQKSAPPTATNATNATYTVKSGDTLLGIALALDVAWEDLAAANDLTEDTFLQIGQKLAVPGAPLSAEPVLMSAKTGSAAPAAEPAAAQGSGRTHRVTSGDTIYGIALAYDVDMDELLRLNDLDEDTLLQLDQELALP